MQTKPLKSSENNFLDLLNFIADPAVIVDEKGHILLVNNAFESITGLSPDNVIGKVFLEVGILAAESKAILLENLKKRMQGLPVKPYEIAFRGKNGEIRHVEVKAKIISYARQPADLVLFRDITRRKRNLAKLKEYSERMEALVEEKIKEIKESEKKFRAITDSALDAMFMFDEEDKIVYWNPAAAKIFGYTKTEIIGKQVNTTLVPPRFRKDHLKLTKRIADAEMKINKDGFWEFPALRKGGIEFPMELSMAPLQLNDKMYVVAVARDITERKKAEEALRSSEEKYRELINGMNDTAWVIALDAKFIDVNDAAVKVLGYSREELLSMGPADIDSSLSAEEISTLVKTMPADQVQVFETSHTTKDGKKIPVEISSSLVTYKGKQAVLSIARDITERKRMQSELAEYSQKLEQLVAKRTEQLKQTQTKLLKTEKLAAIGELAGMIGHDLRNPLTGIKGATYYLKTKYAAEIDATGKEMLSTIENAIDHSNKIINDLLEYSSKLRLDLTETTPKSLLKNALSVTAVPERIQIIDATKNKPKIKADIENMQKVFVNIITNAIDAMPTTGTLTITSHAAEGNVKFVFKDTGTGMTKDTLSKLKLGFPLFTTKAQGMGFGLPICKRIIETHGGKISLKSTLGKGTTVTITIPVNPKPTDENEEKWIFNEAALRALRASYKAS